MINLSINCYNDFNRKFKVLKGQFDNLINDQQYSVDIYNCSSNFQMKLLFELLLSQFKNMIKLSIC